MVNNGFNCAEKKPEYAIVNIQLLIYNCAKIQWCHLQNGE